jgi:hypothetical protein
MRPLRRYKEATIFHKDGTTINGFEVEVFTGFIIYLDDKGNERILPFHYIQDIVNYAEPNGGLLITEDNEKIK